MIISAAMSVIPALQNTIIIFMDANITIFNYKYNVYTYGFILLRSLLLILL